MTLSSPLTPFSLSLVSQKLWCRNDQGSVPRIMAQERGLAMGSAGGRRGERRLLPSEITCRGNLPEALAVKTPCFQSLVKELRSHMPCSAANKEIFKNDKYNRDCYDPKSLLVSVLRPFLDFPGGPGVRTPSFPGKRHGLDPWSGY